MDPTLIIFTTIVFLASLALGYFLGKKAEILVLLTAGALFYISYTYSHGTATSIGELVAKIVVCVLSFIGGIIVLVAGTIGVVVGAWLRGR